MIVTFIVFGILAQAVAWRLVRSGRLRIWTAAGWVFIVLGVGCVLSGQVELWGSVRPWKAVGAGFASALVLFGLTRLFLRVALRWPRFMWDSGRLYGERGKYPLAVAILVASLVAAGEELFWRGIVRDALFEQTGTWGSEGIALLGYIACSAVAGSAPMVVAAIVGGTVWSLLAIWSGGVAASIVCHAAWTGLMITFPPNGVLAEGNRGR